MSTNNLYNPANDDIWEAINPATFWDAGWDGYVWGANRDTRTALLVDVASGDKVREIPFDAESLDDAVNTWPREDFDRLPMTFKLRFPIN